MRYWRFPSKVLAIPDIADERSLEILKNIDAGLDFIRIDQVAKLHEIFHEIGDESFSGVQWIKKLEGDKTSARRLSRYLNMSFVQRMLMQSDTNSELLQLYQRLLREHEQNGLALPDVIEAWLRNSRRCTTQRRIFACPDWGGEFFSIP